MRSAHAAGYRVTPAGSVAGPAGRLRKLRVNKGGYYSFNVKHEGMSFPVLVHQLAAYQKFGEKMAEEGIEVRHEDGDRANNLLGNLLLGTRLDNALDIPSSKRIAISMHAARTTAKLSDDDVAEIRRMQPPLKEIMRRFKVSKCCASYARSGKTYRRRLDTGS